MIEVVGKIGNIIVSILIDSGASNIFVVASVVLNYSLKKSNLEVAGLVQLTSRTKRKVIEIVRQCPLEMNGLNTLVYLNVI